MHHRIEETRHQTSDIIHKTLALIECFFWSRAEEQSQASLRRTLVQLEFYAAPCIRRREPIKDQNDERTATQRCRHENKCWCQNTLYSSQDPETAYQTIGAIS